MKKLLSLPPNLVHADEAGQMVFHRITGLSVEEYYCTCDPEGHRIGSGGGTTWLLEQAYRDEAGQAPFDEWLSNEKRILIHAGGQSRRLPAYAPSGKILTPVPVLRWERGQRLSQDLLSLQLPLYEQLMEMAPEGIHTMIVSGDVLVRTSQPLGAIPNADVVCYGLWLDAAVAKNHGVFVSNRRTPQVLKQMLQKPSVEQLHGLQKQHYYLTDIGVWLLSDRAV
ncbi:MAG: bifunctional fucokinase/L-fucose-1-P-guanylyltransferase, partial [Prevotella sp.]|nr:bifunctional fucokinase/L-fucose-1-P-guanylyltransferase [Prevotella sp.]